MSSKIVKFVKNFQKYSRLSKLSKIVIKFFLSKIFIKICHQTLSSMSQRSLGSLFNVKNQKVAHWVTHSVSEKVTYWAVRWQLKMQCLHLSFVDNLFVCLFWQVQQTICILNIQNYTFHLSQKRFVYWVSSTWCSI